MSTILITGSTDGIGLEAARMLTSLGHHVILHGRNAEKLARAKEELSSMGGGNVEGYAADLSRMDEVEKLAAAVKENHERLDVLINNAGVYNAKETITLDGLDVRFVVNTLAPYLLTQRLLPLLGTSGRVVNLSSAAQATVDPRALRGDVRLSDHAAYAQSKLALTMWSRELGLSLGDQGPAVFAVNPGSLLGTKMVKEAFGVPGSDVRIGAEIICRLALSDDLEEGSGSYFDNDAGRFGSPHADALDSKRSREVVAAIEAMLED